MVKVRDLFKKTEVNYCDRVRDLFNEAEYFIKVKHQSGPGLDKIDEASEQGLEKIEEAWKLLRDAGKKVRAKDDYLNAKLSFFLNCREYRDLFWDNYAYLLDIKYSYYESIND